MELIVYNLAGQQVAKLVKGMRQAGARFGPKTTPDDPDVVAAIEKALA